ncbi:MAG: carbohydrate porin [Caulobacteraceae bacterium]
MKGVGAIAGLAASLCLAATRAGAQIVDPTAAAPPAPAPTSAPAPAATQAKPPAPLFTFTGAYTADLLSDVDGGKATGTRYIDLLKLSAAFDGGAAGRPGFTALVSLEHSNGTSISNELIGDSQAVTNIEATPQAFRLYEAWVREEFAGGALAAKAGFIDLNTTFDVQETAALFLNASDGVGGELGDTGLNGPSIFPTPALAVTGAWRPAEGWTAQLGVFDGVAGDPTNRGRFVAVEISPAYGALVIAQVERRFGKALRLEAGAWTYTADFPALDDFQPDGAPRKIGGDGGVYGLAEGRLLAKGKSDDGGLAGWVRIGAANGEINKIADYVGAGLVYTGPLAGRDKDQAGVAINRAGFGAPARAVAAREGSVLAAAETTFEATYRCVVTDWLSIQPDVQYVVHPGGDLALTNALVIGVRLAFSASR